MEMKVVKKKAPRSGLHTGALIFLLPKKKENLKPQNYTLLYKKATSPSKIFYYFEFFRFFLLKS